MGWTVSSQNSYVEVQLTPSISEFVFGKGAFEEVIKLKYGDQGGP